jgi:hypothetical protein
LSEVNRGEQSAITELEIPGMSDRTLAIVGGKTKGGLFMCQVERGVDDGISEIMAI